MSVCLSLQVSVLPADEEGPHGGEAVVHREHGRSAGLAPRSVYVPVFTPYINRLYNLYIQAVHHIFTGYITSMYRLYTSHVPAQYCLSTGHVPSIRLYVCLFELVGWWWLRAGCV